MKKKLIGIFTGSRAEYGLQYPIIKAIQNHKNLDYLLIVSGTHLDKKFGETKKEIKKDNFKISFEIKLKNSFQKKNKEDLTFIPGNIANIVSKLSFFFKKNKIDMFLVNADRFETFAAAIASTQMNIPTVHVEGGDITEGGTLDDNVRHAITKLSHIHLVTNQQSYANVLKMGEEKWRVYNVGLTSNDNIREKKLLSEKQLRTKFRIDEKLRIIIFTFHSYGSDLKKIKKEIKILSKVIKFCIKKNYSIIATYPNNDYGSNIIVDELKKTQKEIKNKNFILVKSLGNLIFHSLINLSKKNKAILIGNSSAGIKECVAFKCPAIDIGERQKSRLKPDNVISSACSFSSVIKNISKAFDNKNYKFKVKKSKNPYYKKDTGKTIADILNKINCEKKILIKKHIF